MTELDPLVVDWQALIDQFGIVATFTLDAGTFDDATSTWNPAPSTVDRKVTPPTSKRQQTSGIITERTVSYVAANDLGFVPFLGMLVTIDGRAYRVTMATSVYGGALVHVYELELS